MKILIVGGNGFVGGTTAIYLKACGYDVTLMSRSRPIDIPGLRDFPHIKADYVNDFSVGSGSTALLEGFDSMLFCAGNSIKNFDSQQHQDYESFYHLVNTESIPRFFAQAKSAGVKRCVYLGSFYPQVAPEQIEIDPYVRSRHLSDQAVRQLSEKNFNVCSVNAPYILGSLPGLRLAHIEMIAAFAKGERRDIPFFAPPGGTNHMTVSAVAQALKSALFNGESAKAYLVGDENLSWKDYFERWFELAGNPRQLIVRDDEHPLVPRVVMYAGVNSTVSYEPDPTELERIQYERGGLSAAMSEILK